jgi:hypothetical protein
MITVNPPLLLFKSIHRCWQCDTMQEVIALGAVSLSDDEGDPGRQRQVTECVLLSEIGVMPADVAEYLRRNFPRYARHYSRTAGMSYYANMCECGANFGDHFLFSEPGGAFYPETELDASQIMCMELPFRGQSTFDCSYNVGLGQMILCNARAETHPQAQF